MEREHPGQKPAVLFVDRGFSADPFADALGAQLDVRAADPPLAGAGVVALVTGIAPIGAAEIADLPDLRLVLTCSIGVDHLDLDALRARGIVVCNTPHYCTEEVADHALASVLALWRGLPALDRSVRAGAWDWSAAGVLRRFSASTLGVVGLGRIGRSVARKAAALGIDVLGCDPLAGDDLPGVRRVDLDTLLRAADGVTLHAPGAAGGAPLIGARELALMRPGAVLVNAARAQLVDLDALADALRAGRLAAAAFDVWSEEPPDPADPRPRLPNLLLTPHAGWYSTEADAAYQAEGIAVLRAVLLDGTEPASRVA